MFAKADKVGMDEECLPIDYNSITQRQRAVVRLSYIRMQDGICIYCGNKFVDGPSKMVEDTKINTDLFPPNFFEYPTHLHHNHDTGMTIGAIHARCNAVLWQYHNE